MGVTEVDPSAGPRGPVCWLDARPFRSPVELIKLPALAAALHVREAAGDGRGGGGVMKSQSARAL
jgi:hypothetical protein